MGCRQHGFWLFGPDYAPTIRQRIQVAIPPGAPPNRALWAVLTLWRKKGGEFSRQKINDSDLQLLDDRQVVLGELVLPDASTAKSLSLLAAFDNGFKLEEVELPEAAQAGETLRHAIRLAQRCRWRGRSHSVSAFRPPRDRRVVGFDQQPLGPRLPTRLWYKGLADSETWTVPLPADLAPGRYAVYTGLYRPGDLLRVPASDAAGRPWRDARALLGHLRVD